MASKPKYIRVKVNKLDVAAKKEFIKSFKDAPKRHLDNLDFFGVYDVDRLIGGIIINPKPDNFHYNSLGLYPNIIVEFLYVLKEYRGHGIGSKLFKIALKRKTAGLRTGGMTSDIAKKLYLKSGFRVVKERGLVSYWYYDKKSKAVMANK